MIGKTREDVHVAIAGAGIAGSALAISLHRKGIFFNIYGAAKEYSVVGAGIDFGPNRMRALDLIEPGFRHLYEALCTTNKGERTEHIFFEGSLLGEDVGREQQRFGNSAWGHPDYVRKSFLELVEQHPHRVILKFADGTTAEASLLAGSDGIESVVRVDILGPSSDRRWHQYYFGVNFLSAKIGSNPWVIEKKSMTETTTHEAMMAEFKGKNMDPGSMLILAKHRPVKWGLIHHWRTSTYYQGRSVLLDNAAHASMPFQAVGAAQGVEDALVMMEVLAKVAETHESFGDTDAHMNAGLEPYDAVRRSRAQHQ
ncbi:FAD/NAD(P)-binding domain-containing protein [Alternaria alternata]|uniref:FAD/NAD(P)-binding domain-containing protein n=1 Tax=Alternaria alternata TaxID=5599 RepID=A0A177DKZ6_ALTAL|nr:FAD/NAD(P)-binding domain-containing protein [Alternaria alternata]OAG20483.1 FAD/NAD(P)-binding domain-containing protein [Alternaria alternata]